MVAPRRYANEPDIREDMALAVRAAAAVLRSGRQDGNGSERDMLELAKEVANDFYDAIVLSAA